MHGVISHFKKTREERRFYVLLAQQYPPRLDLCMTYFFHVLLHLSYNKTVD